MTAVIEAPERRHGSYARPSSSEASPPFIAHLNGKAEYIYHPTDHQPLRITLERGQPQPQVRWDNMQGAPGEFFIRTEGPLAGEAKNRVVVELPTLHNGRVRLPFEGGEFCVRKNDEELLLELPLKPELQADGSYLYHGPQANDLSFSLGESGQQPPSVIWRQRSGTDAGEFFMRIDRGKEIDAMHTNARATVELPLERDPLETRKGGPIVSIEHGSFHIRRGSHDEAYIETIGNIDRLEARGEGISREAYVVVSADSVVQDLYLHGHTYIQTHDVGLLHRIFPPTDVIGAVHVANEVDEFRNDRINAYELGRGDYSLAALRSMEFQGLDRRRSGHGHRLKRFRGKGEEYPKDEISEVTVKTESRGPVVTLEAVDLQGRYLWKPLLENFRAAGIADPSKLDVKIAQMLTYIANGTDKTPPKGVKTKMLTEEALQLLIERAKHQTLDSMITDMIHNPEPHLRTYQHVSDMVKINDERGIAILRHMHKILNAHMVEEKAQAAEQVAQERKAAIDELQRHIQRHRAALPATVPLFTKETRRPSIVRRLFGFGESSHKRETQELAYADTH